jgi:pyrimidine deaminase RibD-like protein
MGNVDDLAKQILADLVADFRAKDLGSDELDMGYVGPFIAALATKYCTNGPHSKVDFDLALKQLEESKFVATGPMVPHENTPGSGLIFTGVYSKREFVYLTEKGYKAAQKPAKRRSPIPIVHGQDEDDDHKCALLAIQEARKSVPEQDGRPHPKVGAVVVKDGKVLSTAHRGERPENHAEYIALEKKLGDEVVAGATVYTTLEPCTTRNHPKIPCVERLIERKVKRVVIGMLDPDDRISGKGQRKLRKAGIVTDLFPHDLAMEVEELNREFTRYCEQQSQMPTPVAPSQNVQGSGQTKLGTILSYKGKAVTVINRTKNGPHISESIWPYETVVEDCNPLWVTLKNPGGQSSFPLTQVEVNFDNEKQRLRLEIDR